MKITVRSPYWSEFELDVSPEDYVELVKDKIAEEKNLSLREIWSMYVRVNGKLITDELTTMSELDVVDGSTFYLYKRRNNAYYLGGRPGMWG